MATMLSDLNQDARRHVENGEWGLYRNARYERAEHLRRNGHWEQAGVLYVEVLIFDLQGVTGGAGPPQYHEAYRSPMPAVVREVARFSLRSKMDGEEFRAVYRRVIDEIWMDAFPRSPQEVWTELRAHVVKAQEALALDQKVEALGGDGLLSKAEAQKYIERKNAYELVRRVEQLLENESPPDIPAEKRERVELYLAAVEPSRLADRWKAKAYRRGAEVMWSHNGTEKALEYAEEALKVVDPDELAAIEQMRDQLQSDLYG